MFLALKEIKKEKVRSGMIIAMIALIGYLIFILTSLALGLARQNTDAINSWNIDNVTLNDSANVDLRQSIISQKQVGNLTDDQALIGQSPVVVKAKDHANTSAAFVGLQPDQFIAKNLSVSSGRKATSVGEVVADDSFKTKGYKLGDTVTLNNFSRKFKIVGFTPGAKLNISPVLYGQLSTWRQLKGSMPGVFASAIVSKDADYKTKATGMKTYSKATFINKLPGYSAQNLTFGLMIFFLMLISLIVIAVFLYILTMQKLPNYAVLRAQGIPSKMLVGATISQSLILAAAGLVLATALTVITALAMPASVPVAFDISILTAAGAGLLVMALLGSLIPIRSVLKVDPVSVIGG
ncbi:ABC transporter permease [uncultured Secundilactobacillus sp.]|uniref:ABC transporter permease n=1 Tax=uncultured Secundilactobacillus sp. TaxID=2813935 RepID=UPI002587A166|nr:ABC transporter permease [uncultured Secundilactobacillus sp.]